MTKLTDLFVASSATTKQLPAKDCLSCKITGSGAMCFGAVYVANLTRKGSVSRFAGFTIAGALACLGISVWFQSPNYINSNESLNAPTLRAVGDPKKDIE